MRLKRLKRVKNGFFGATLRYSWRRYSVTPALTNKNETCEYAQEALYSLGKRPSYVEGSDMLELALKTLEKAPGGKSKSFAPDLKDAIYKELDDDRLKLIVYELITGHEQWTVSNNNVCM